MGVASGDVAGGVFDVGVALGSGVASGDEVGAGVGEVFGEVAGGCAAVDDGISWEALGCGLEIGGEVAGTSDAGAKEGVGDSTAGVTGVVVVGVLSDDEVG